MKIDKSVIIGIVLVVLVAFGGITFTLKKDYNKAMIEFEKTKDMLIKKQKHLVDAQTKLKEKDVESWLKQLDALYEKRYNKLDAQIEKELKQRVYVAYNKAKDIYAKYHRKKSSKDIKQRIKDALEGMVFITNFQTNPILIHNQKFGREDITNYVDADFRSIVLEELQKVRRREEALIKSRHAPDALEEIIFVKNLNMYEWFIGDNIFKKDKVKELNISILKILDAEPINSSNFLAVFDKDKKLILSKNISKDIKFDISKPNQWHKDKKYNYLINYIKGLDSYIVYGFWSN
jgi:hypothetical protein